MRSEGPFDDQWFRRRASSCCWASCCWVKGDVGGERGNDQYWKKRNGWWLDVRLIDWLIDWYKGMADWMNGILKETRTKCLLKLCEEEANYKCVDISIYISLLWIDSARLRKKITIVSVRLPSVFVDDGLDAFAVILPQDCWAPVHVIPGIDDGDVEIAGSARALFFWALLQMVFVPILQHAL